MIDAYTRIRALPPLMTSPARNRTRSHLLSLLSMARLNKARSRIRFDSYSRTRMAQISRGLRGSFCPTSRPLFQGVFTGSENSQWAQSVMFCFLQVEVGEQNFVVVGLQVECWSKAYGTARPSDMTPIDLWEKLIIGWRRVINANRCRVPIVAPKINQLGEIQKCWYTRRRVGT